MSKLDELIKKLCPDGVEYKTLGEVCDVTAGGDVPKNSFSKEKNEQFLIPIISNGIAENALYGWTNEAKIFKTSVTVAARGTIGYAEYRDYPYFPIVRLLSAIPKNENLNTKFLFYCLQGREYQVPKSGIPQLTVPKLKEEKIPVPPLPVQEEIVRILDKFTSLEAELEAELEARRKQYEYYRDSLLTFGDDAMPDGRQVEWKTLADIVSQDCSISYGIVQPGDGVTNGIPVVRPVDMTSKIVHREGLKQTTKEISDSYKRTILKGDELLICVRGTTGIISFAGKDLIGCNVTRGIVPLSFNENIDSSYMFHILKSTEIQNKIEEETNGAGLRQINMKDLRELKIPIPSLKNQKKIGNILDRFESLCNDISIGLPAEIEARHKQYEYYRDKLLTFKRKSS